MPEINENEKESKKVDLFDFLNSISHTKEYLLNEETIKQYNPYMINRFLSADQETLQFVDWVIDLPNLDKKMHYDFLMKAVPARKRYFKYIKSEKLENEELVMKAFGYSRSKAKDAIAVLRDEDYEQIRQKFEIGGVQHEKVGRAKKHRK